MEAVAEFEKSPSAASAFALGRAAILSPTQTFSTMPLDGPWLPATVIALLVGMVLWCDEVHSLRGSIDSLRAMPQIAEALNSPMGRDLLGSMGGDGGWFAVWLAGLPTVPVGLFFSVLSLHACLVVCGAAGGGVRGTWRVTCYSAIGGLLGLIPILGSLIGLCVVSVQLVVGLKHVHRSSSARILLALSLPMLVVGAMLVLLMVLVLAPRLH